MRCVVFYDSGSSSLKVELQCPHATGSMYTPAVRIRHTPNIVPRKNTWCSAYDAAVGGGGGGGGGRAYQGEGMHLLRSYIQLKAIGSLSTQSPEATQKTPE